MNNRIKELMLEAGYAAPEIATRANKLAQLIIKECIEEIEFQYGGGNLMEDGETHNPEWDKAIECVSAMVRTNFGIKK